MAISPGGKRILCAKFIRRLRSQSKFQKHGGKMVMRQRIVLVQLYSLVLFLKGGVGQSWICIVQLPILEAKAGMRLGVPGMQFDCLLI